MRRWGGGGGYGGWLVGGGGGCWVARAGQPRPVLGGGAAVPRPTITTQASPSLALTLSFIVLKWWQLVFHRNREGISLEYHKFINDL